MKCKCVRCLLTLKCATILPQFNLFFFRLFIDSWRELQLLESGESKEKRKR